MFNFKYLGTQFNALADQVMDVKARIAHAMKRCHIYISTRDTHITHISLLVTHVTHIYILVTLMTHIYIRDICTLDYVILVREVLC